MLELSRILVIIEPDEESLPALEKAVQLAKYADSELELMISDYNAYLEDGYYFDPVQAQKMRYEHGEHHIAEMEKLADPLREQGLTVSVSTAWGNPPYEEVVKRVEETKPSLVIKSTRHHNKLARVMLSNEDWELIRYCSAPLLLVKSHLWENSPVFIASVDPDHANDKPAALDKKIISTAQALASISGGDVQLFHSAWLPPLSGVYPVEPNEEEESKKLGELAKRNDICESATHWSGKDVLHALPEKVTELNASAVIMGAVSRSRLDRVLIGNTAEKILDRLECDVLVVKPDDMPPPAKVLL
jgi:universal stress protein E